LGKVCEFLISEEDAVAEEFVDDVGLGGVERLGVVAEIRSAVRR